MVPPNKRRATPSGLIQGAAHRDWPLFRTAALLFACVQLARETRKALQDEKMTESTPSKSVRTGPDYSTRNGYELEDELYENHSV
ncbi:hypothetical protein MMIC_P1681 [Mariprofundus micogutta]|uniref:Uncharacterized protein n=1 Tax=Mariprofundus micogutta TaxID=1921010 RepID=A0A1L8CP75_9PROT|nr:hypothetical protein MMIC_P1681 [Mariprofundus micogutta]